MASRDGLAEALRDWLRVPQAIETALEGLAENDLDLRGGANAWSIRETVHHLVEANLVASNLVIAALGKSGCTYDWSWVTPDRAWMARLGYDTAPIGPALETLRALCKHIAGVLLGAPQAAGCAVKLLDAPGAELHAMTAEEVIRQEVEHAQEHLRDVAETRRQHAR